MLQLHYLLSNVWAFDPDTSLSYLPVVAAFLKGESGGREPLRIDSRQSYETRVKSLTAPIAEGANKAHNVGFGYGEWYPEEIEEDAVAVMRLTGAITKYTSCENYGQERFNSMLSRCYANEKIKGIVMVLDTPGGETRAMVSTISTLQARNKPVIAFVSDGCYSAGMGIAAQCDAIIANNEFARVGSIGTMLTLMDKKKYFEEQGINIIELYASASTEKNKDYRDIVAGKTKEAIAILDTINESFLSAVESGRSERLTADRTQWGTGRTFSTQEALSMGLIDGIDTLPNVIDYIHF